MKRLLFSLLIVAAFGSISASAATQQDAEEGKYSLNIAVGCTGGQHRSVAVANELGRMFTEEGYRVSVEHREH